MITTFGEIMLRISPSNAAERITQATGYRIEPGGSESNVAIALANLGMNTSFITSLPDNPLGQKVIEHLRQFGVQTDYIIQKGERIGVYYTETGIGPRSSFVIYDRENSSFSQSNYQDYNWELLFEMSKWFHFSGISPAISEEVAELLKTVIDKCSCSYSVDLNFRAKLWSWLNKDKEKISNLMSALCSKATLIAGNETDFQNIFGIKSLIDNEDNSYEDIASQCFNKFRNAQYIAISNRKSLSASLNNWNGYLFVKNDKNFSYKGMSYELDDIQDRVGTGDSFVAGIIYGLLNNDKFNYKNVVDFAVSLSALNHTTKGDASRFTEADVLKVINSKGSGRIIR